MCGGTGAPQNMADAEVNGIYADIQNPVMIGSITGKKKKKKVGPDETKGKRLMRRDGRSPSVQLKCRHLTTGGQQSIKYRSLEPGQKKSMTDMSHTAKQKTEKKPHSPSERRGRD